MAPQIYISKQDKEKLLTLINEVVRQDVEGVQYVRLLEDELQKAMTLDGAALPDDVVSMNSTILLSTDDVEETVTLVYPGETDVSANKISVFSPIGTAILGCRAGYEFEWDINGKPVRIAIKHVTQRAL